MEETLKRKSSIGSYLLVFVAIILVGALIFFLTSGRRGGSNPINNLVPTGESNAISIDEVGAHANADSCWIVIEGKVYDVTSFIPNHPGEEAILMGCGKDATEMFNSRPSDGTSHSSRARSILSDYQIGVLE